MTSTDPDGCRSEIDKLVAWDASIIFGNRFDWMRKYGWQSKIIEQLDRFYRQNEITILNSIENELMID
jgi:hypothetical protein